MIRRNIIVNYRLKKAKKHLEYLKTLLWESLLDKIIENINTDENNAKIERLKIEIKKVEDQIFSTKKNNIDLSNNMYITNKKQLAQRKELELKKAQRKETETQIKKVVYDTSSLVGLGIVALFFLTIIIQILS